MLERVLPYLCDAGLTGFVVADNQSGRVYADRDARAWMDAAGGDEGDGSAANPKGGVGFPRLGLELEPCAEADGGALRMWWLQGADGASGVGRVFERALAAKNEGAVVRGMSHDVRGALNSVLLNAQLADELAAELGDTEDAVTLQRTVAGLQRSAQVLREQLRDMLAVAGLGAETQPVAERVDVVAMARETNDLAARIAKKANVDLEARLPQGSVWCAVRSDALRHLMLWATRSLIGLRSDRVCIDVTGGSGNEVVFVASLAESREVDFGSDAEFESLAWAQATAFQERVRLEVLPNSASISLTMQAG